MPRHESSIAKGLLTLLVSALLGLALGKGLTTFLEVVANNGKTASLVGFAFGFLAFITALAYLPLWLDPAEYAHPRTGGFEGKLQTAALRFAMVFAIVGGLCTYGITNSRPTAIGAALGFAFVGALLGVDLKRRVQRLRAKPHYDELIEPLR